MPEIKKDEEQLRIIPLTEEFMKNKLIYDKIWAYLQLHSYKSYDGKRFVYSGVIENKSLMFENIVNSQQSNEQPFCSKTFNKAFSLLLEPTPEQLEAINNETDEKKKSKLIKTLPLGYITKGKVLTIDKTEEVDCYYLKEDFDLYKLIPKDTLEYLFVTANNNVIKIYAFLLNCYSYKKSYQKTDEPYLFTKQQLADAIGYSSKSKNKEIDYILESLESCGLIKYHKQQVQTSKTTTTIYFALDYASLKRNNQKFSF